MLTFLFLTITNCCYLVNKNEIQKQSCPLKGYKSGRNQIVTDLPVTLVKTLILVSYCCCNK
jgi:hypothetical protein